jgi:hypothetical protein
MNITILEDERKQSQVKACENCNQVKSGRHVEVFDRFTRGSRGFVFICFDCFKPRVLWSGGPGKASYWTR